MAWTSFHAAGRSAQCRGKSSESIYFFCVYLLNCSLQVFSMRSRSSLAPHFIYSVIVEALNWSVLLVLLNC